MRALSSTSDATAFLITSLRVRLSRSARAYARALLLRGLNQLDAVAGRIHCDADDDPGVTERTGLTGHRSACSFDRGDRGVHVGHIEDHVCDRIFGLIGVAVHDDE